MILNKFFVKVWSYPLELLIYLYFIHGVRFYETLNNFFFFFESAVLFMYGLSLSLFQRVHSTKQRTLML